MRTSGDTVSREGFARRDLSRAGRPGKLRAGDELHWVCGAGRRIGRRDPDKLVASGNYGAGFCCGSDVSAGGLKNPFTRPPKLLKSNPRFKLTSSTTTMTVQMKLATRF